MISVERLESLEIFYTEKLAEKIEEIKILKADNARLEAIIDGLRSQNSDLGWIIYPEVAL